MARKPRFNLAGLTQHVIQRGNNRQATFFAETDYGFYLDCLGEAAQQYGCALHAYVLMTNHVHLLATPGQPDGLSRMMQSVGRRYVQYVNYSYRRSGTLWEGRYKASPVQDERYLLLCSRYIELNPVRANMAQGPEDYRWSSYRANALGEADARLTRNAEYVALGKNEDERLAAYRALFATQLDTESVAELRSAVNREGITGESRFTFEIEAALQRRVQPRPRGRPRKDAGVGMAMENVNEQMSLLGECK